MGGSEPLISPSVRYSAAWNEVCARITIRSNFNVYHVTTIIALTAVHFAIRNNANDGLEFKLLIAIFMPIVSLIFVLRYYHIDLIIGALSSYCAHFEKIDYTGEFSAYPPWFYSPSKNSLMLQILKYREWSDMATQIICVASPVLLIVDFVEYLKFGIDLPHSANLPEISLIVLIYTSCLVLPYFLISNLRKLARRRTAVLNSVYNKVDGSWSRPEI